MNNIQAILYYTTIILANVNGANILGLFPTASFSHQQSLLELSYALGAKGHTLTILTTIPSKVPIKNVREIDISSLYKDWEKMQSSGVVSLQKRNQSKFKLIKDLCYWKSFVTSSLIEKPVFKEFVREVNGTKFDLILYEPIGYSGLLGIREITGNPPTVGIITLHPFVVADDPVGNPLIPSYIPSVFLDYSDKMNIWERFLNGYAELYSRYIFYTCTMAKQQIHLQQAFGDLKRTAIELEFDRSLLIFSGDFATGYARPLQPNTVYVGPMHLKKAAPLPQDLQKWMDEAEDGVIYFSMGSNVKGTSIPEHIRNAFINAFREFPKVRVLWKWESDTNLPGLPDNILMRKWLPQVSILGHPKTKVFISQCGLQSLQEAIDNIVPMMAIPIFGDQNFNSRRLVDTGAGLRLEFDDITFEEVYEKLKDLLTNKSYRDNMQRLSSIAKDKPMSAVDTAVWWVEYVIRHKGAPHLRPAGLDLTWYQYYMLDILLILIVLLSIVLYIVYFIINRLMWFLSSNFTKSIKRKDD